MTDTPTVPPNRPPPQTTKPKAGANTKQRRPQLDAAASSVMTHPIAGPAQVRKRHWGLILTFILLVLAPTGLTGYYLFTISTDQYASRVGFSVRTEETGSAIEILGGITELSGSSSTDTDILNEYIRSQELVQLIDQNLDLRALYKTPNWDPIFSFDPDGTIEDLVAYWGRVVRINYDGSSKLIEIRVLAFQPQEAQAIAQAIFEESSRMINDLSDIAREDTIRYARTELERAVERLKQARAVLTQFRSVTQIVDPQADIQGQMGLLNTLQAQLAETLIEYDLLTQTTSAADPRIVQADRRVAVIRARIIEERRKFGAGDSNEGGEDYATLISEFERLNVDRQFAEQAYVVALSAFDSAQADARRQSRYLAAYIKPTLAERAEFPNRPLLLALVALFSMLGWGILTLIFYSLRDRR